MEGDAKTLRLPEGYGLRTLDHDPERQAVLVLTRADGSAVAAFEFSAFGPDPGTIWALAVEDEQRVSAARGALRRSYTTSEGSVRGPHGTS